LVLLFSPAIEGRAAKVNGTYVMRIVNLSQAKRGKKRKEIFKFCVAAKGGEEKIRPCVPVENEK
jgi:hypothetical protein